MAKYPKPASVSPITEREKRRRMYAVQGADAVNAIEGAPISDYAKQLSARWVNGEIPHVEMVAALIRRHKRPAEGE